MVDSMRERSLSIDLTQDIGEWWVSSYTEKTKEKERWMESELRLLLTSLDRQFLVLKLLQPQAVGLNNILELRSVGYSGQVSLRYASWSQYQC